MFKALRARLAQKSWSEVNKSMPREVHKSAPYGKPYLFVDGPLHGQTKRFTQEVSEIYLPAMTDEGLRYLTYYRQTLRSDLGVNEVFVLGGVDPSVVMAERSK